MKRLLLASVACVALATPAFAEHGIVVKTAQGNGYFVFGVCETPYDPPVNYAFKTDGTGVGPGGQPIAATTASGWVTMLIDAQSTHQVVGFDIVSPPLPMLSVTWGAGVQFFPAAQAMNINNPPDDQQ